MSSNAKFFYYNLLTLDTPERELRSGGENPFYPLDNLTHPHALKTYRSSGSETAVIFWDFQTPVTADHFLAVGSSITGLNLTAVTIEANALDTWASPGFTTTVTDFDYEANIATKAFSSPQTYRYWRITLTGTGGYVEVAKIFLGQALQLTSNNVAIGFQFGSEDLSETVKGRYGQRFIDEISDLRYISGAIGLMTAAEQSEIQAMFDYCGSSRPLWLILDPDELIVTNKDALSGYFYLTERPSFKNDFFGLYSTEFNLEEAK